MRKLLLAIIIAVLTTSFAVASVVLVVENKQLKGEVERLAVEIDEADEFFIIEEGEIVSVDDLEASNMIKVLYTDGSGKPVALIEVDVFYELIHTTIEVGDTAVYCRDKKWTDADLLAIIKKESKVSIKEQMIIELALADIDEAGDVELEFISIESVPWLDWDCATYILTVNDKLYLVGVQEKDNVVHFVDVIEEIDADDLATIKRWSFELEGKSDANH